LTTLHGYAKTKRKESMYDSYRSRTPEMYFNAISESQKDLFSSVVKADGVVYNGIDASLLRFNSGNLSDRDYLFSVGRISEFKGQDFAIDVAKKLNKDLIIAGKVAPSDKDFFKSKIEPNLTNKIKYIGNISNSLKNSFYRGAECFLMPIRWHEPFGLVVVESMASGTPVVAFRKGSMPEIIEEGKTGFVVDTVDEMAKAVKMVHNISPTVCRRTVSKRFNTERMAKDYISLYENIINGYDSKSK
jgi:glycosyltransferase involved in cell wall biosynthesis